MNCALVGSRFVSQGAMMMINKIIRTPVGADLSRTPPIDRPSEDVPLSDVFY